jgi:hypothetical protein
MRPSSRLEGDEALRSRGRPLPTFLIIGAQKSATRWLRVNLGLHPDVYTAPTELEFFNKAERFARGTRWYCRQFEGWSDERIVGESTPGYMFWRERPDLVAARIAQVVPDVRLIAILRNPIDRAQSAMVHHIKFSRLSNEWTLVELARRAAPEDDPLGIISGGWYAASLTPYLERFRDQLLVVLDDDRERDAQETYDRAVRHIDAAPGFFPPDLERVLFSNQKDPSRTPPGIRALEPAHRVELYEYFADDIEQLEHLLERDLSIWRPPPTG